jgi:Electron transfer DM13
VNLGKLKGNKGSQNYELAADIDPAKFASVVIGCKRFTVGFGVAPLVVSSARPLCAENYSPLSPCTLT